MEINGVWLPIITPFKNDDIDYSSYKNILLYYLDKGVSGIIPLGTTGESPAIEEDEFEKLIAFTLEVVENKVPIFIGLGGNYTNHVIQKLKRVERYNFKGILSVSPYYNRPSQIGIYEHFKKISEATEKKIILYNIPYRTGRNIENETIFQLAELDNIVGLKDSSGNLNQTMELLLNKPENFSVLTGEDLQYFNALALGANGGILASAHIQTDKFTRIYDLMQSNNHFEARKIWKELAGFIPLLFHEPNPGPIKYLLKKQGLICSDETRLPITEISDELKQTFRRLASLL